jgi:hypothetical protein
MKKNTVTTISIRSPIDLLLKVNASANMSSQAKCQRFDSKKFGFSRQPDGWQVAICKVGRASHCSLQGEVRLVGLITICQASAALPK